METRQHKRRWRSSLSGSLDFDKPAQSAKKRRKTMTEVSSQQSTGSEKTFSICSFYGKREKPHFPHSPKTRREKLSDENRNTDSENDQRHTRVKSVKGKDKSKFDFHSSTSADSDTDPGRVLKQSNTKLTANKKVPLKVKRVQKTVVVTPKVPVNIKSQCKTQSHSTSKLPDRLAGEKELQSPHVSGKKFFRTRSPASADKCFGSVIVKKGFQITFVPKRSKSSSKNTSTKSGTTSKTKQVKSVKANKMLPFSNIGAREAGFESSVSDLYSSSSLKTDGTKVDSQAEETEAVPENEKIQYDTVVKAKLDSGVGMTNSSDTYTTGSIGSSPVASSRPPCESEDDGTISLISETFGTTGSRDLFCTDSEFELPVHRMFPSSMTSVSAASPMQDMSDGGPNSPELMTPNNCTQDSTLQDSPSSSASGELPPSSTGSPTGSAKKLFPIFCKQQVSPTHSKKQKNKPGNGRSYCASDSPLLKYVRSKDNKEQMIIDAGQQKRYGATQCDVCGMVYTQSEPVDETMHKKFHKNLLNVLKFPGWKNERVVQEYPNTGCRVIRVSDTDPSYQSSKVEKINKIMGEELGFPESNMSLSATNTAYLYISEEKTVEGCCVFETISEGYRVIPDGSSQGSSGSSQNHPGQRPWCCSDIPERALVGISRIWVYSGARRKGVASKLLDCVRQWSSYGTVIPRSKMAFSDPTPEGKLLATNYTGKQDFLVYKYHVQGSK